MSEVKQAVKYDERKIIKDLSLNDGTSKTKYKTVYYFMNKYGLTFDVVMKLYSKMLDERNVNNA